MGKQFFYMLVSYAEWERNVIRERMFSGKLRRARDGRSPGFPPPYGYKKGPTPGALLVDEAEARIVRLVFDLADQGQTVRAIARQLGARGCRGRKGAPFGTSTVSKLLHNPAYAGRLVWGRTRSNPRWHKAPGEPRVKAAEPYVALPSPNIPVLVDPEQWDRVQRLMAANRKIQSGALASCHLLTGLLRCGRCGQAMQHNAYGRWAYYRCAGRQGQGLCDAPAVRAERLDQAVAGAVRARYAAAAAAGARDLAAQPAPADGGAEAVAAQLARLAAQERRIDQDYLTERLTADERRRLLTAVAAERADLEQALERLQAEAAAAGAAGRRLAERLDWDDDLLGLLSPAEQKQLLRFFIAGIRVADGVVTITWKAGA
jgi:site-specific DNA recombinase